jgi:hypothetical protein
MPHTPKHASSAPMDYDRDGAEMLGLIGPQNPKLTEELVQAKAEWKALLAVYRANSHAKFLHQTALGRIVAHVRAHTEKPDSSPLVRDVVRWENECEQLSTPERDQLNWDGSDDSPDDASSVSSGASEGRRVPRLRMPLDYQDVQPYLRADELEGVTYSTGRSNRNAVTKQNKSLRKEIAKWKKSAGRIRSATLVEVKELLNHQRALRKVVDRIRQDDATTASSAPPCPVVDDVVRWYDECRREAEHCGALSEEAAVDYIWTNMNDHDAREYEMASNWKVDGPRPYSPTVKDVIPEDEELVLTPVVVDPYGDVSTGSQDQRTHNHKTSPSPSPKAKRNRRTHDQGKQAPCTIM